LAETTISPACDWLDGPEPRYKQNGGTGYLDYLKGEIADITLTQ
jgi:hypothetical protein